MRDLTDAQELWKPAAVPELPQWTDLSGDAALLLKRQKRMLPVAERELTQYGRKVSCWAWWVFFHATCGSLRSPLLRRGCGERRL